MLECSGALSRASVVGPCDEAAANARLASAAGAGVQSPGVQMRDFGSPAIASISSFRRLTKPAGSSR